MCYLLENPLHQLCQPGARASVTQLTVTVRSSAVLLPFTSPSVIPLVMLVVIRFLF
jgi:hypothetical protein